MKCLFQIFLLVFCAFGFRAQNSDSPEKSLLPFVENFSKSEYDGDNQVWGLTQGGDKAMYFANNHFFIRYNGVKWERYSLPNRSIIRSVMADGEKIYTGTYNDFGFWVRKDGQMVYKSISDGTKSFDPDKDNEEVWKIFKIGKKVYFQSFNALYILGTNGKISKLSFPYQISYCYVIDGKIYAATVRHGIYVFESGHFVKKNSWSVIDRDVIHHIGKWNNQIFVFTKNNGIFIENGQTLTPWSHPLNNQLKEQTILSARFLDKSRLAIGSGMGLYLIDLGDGSFRNISRENGINNNAVLSLALDSENDLWLGLDNGIAHVEVNSPVNVFSDNSGIMGSVYALSPMDTGGYLLVTNNGIFTYKASALNRVPGSQGQVWDIYKQGNRFLLGHNDGTFVFDEQHLQKANGVNGGWKFLKSDLDGAYYQANYAGIACYRDISNLSEYTFLSGFTKPIRNVAQNKAGELWAADNYKSLYRVTFDRDFRTKKVENISALNGIRNDYAVKIFNYKNVILFLIDEVWYTFNPISAKLEKDELFNTSFKGIEDIIPVNDESFIVEKSGLLYVIVQKGDAFDWELIPEKYYQGKVILENTKAYKSGNNIFINLDDGFIAYRPQESGKDAGEVTIEGFNQGKLLEEGASVKNSSAVELHVVSPFFGYHRPNLYYQLNSGSYIKVVGGQIVLNNLSGGNQKVKVYSFDGKSFRFLKEYGFYVKFPWYISGWMILVYLLALVVAFYVYWRWNYLRTKQKLELQKEEHKHQQEIMEIELRRANDQNVQDYEKHILELELQAKSNQVAGKSLSIAKQSEMIEVIEKILDSEGNPGKLKTEIKKVIKHNAVKKHEWESFESNLNQAHSDFIGRLTKLYPQLTSKDIRLCIYLKMNMSSKEIAPLMNISFRGVELHRYRLRKKLGLDAQENVSKFMAAL